MLQSEPYRLLEATEPAEALTILQNEPVDLVILDVMLPGTSGLEFCRYLKSEPTTRLIPILMVASVNSVEEEIAGITAGADQFLHKPVHPSLMLARIRDLLRKKQVIDSLEEAETILFALARAVEHLDPYTAGHCERLALYSLRLGSAVGLPRADLLALYRGGFLHDVGKIAVPDCILYKRGPLTEQEWRIMKTHPIKGEEICKPMRCLSGVLPIIRSHHERWDGSGYPDGLRGEQIPFIARVLQIADIYDALTTVRPYKPALSVKEALEELSREAALGWRDPELVAAFINLMLNGKDQAIVQEFSSDSQLEVLQQFLSNPSLSNL